MGLGGRKTECDMDRLRISKQYLIKYNFIILVF